MAKFGGDHWRGNVGLRVVRTNQTSRGNQLFASNPPPDAIPNPFGAFLPIEVKRHYTDFLPSVNLSFDLSRQLVLRFAAARTMARPDYTDIVPRVTLNPGALTRQRRRSARRSLPRQPVRRLAGMVSGPRDHRRGGALLQGHPVLHRQPHDAGAFPDRDPDAEPVALHAGRSRQSEPFQLPVRHQPPVQRPRRHQQGHRAAGFAADLGRLRRDRQLHLFRRQSRQRRPDPWQLEARLQRRPAITNAGRSRRACPTPTAPSSSSTSTAHRRSTRSRRSRSMHRRAISSPRISG